MAWKILQDLVSITRHICEDEASDTIGHCQISMNYRVFFSNDILT